MLELRTLGGLDLTDPAGSDPRPLLRGAKRAALLAYLAIAAPGAFHRRDTLLGLFWPESGERHARSSLRNTLHVLRVHLGPDVLENRGDEEVRIAEGALRCDAVVFRELIAAGRVVEALELYRGELIPGLFVPDAPGFEDWLARERDALQRAAFDAAWSLAEDAEQAGDVPAAAAAARRATDLVPLDENAVRGLMRLLARSGDRVGALAAFEAFRERLHAQLDDAPSPATLALAEEIREHAAAAPAAPGDASHVPTFVAPPEPRAEAPPPPRRRRASPALVGTVLAIGVLVGTAVWSRVTPPTDAARVVLAIGAVQADGGPDDAEIARVLPDMLSTSLARSDAVRVISAARLHDVFAALGGDASLAVAAGHAGADELIEGVLTRVAGGGLRLELRRIHLATGEVRAVHRAEGTDPFRLVDDATASLIPAFGGTPPVERIASVTTASLLAYGFYEEGVRAYVEGDNRTATRFLTAALREDPDFAMAAYYRAETRRTTDHASFRDDLHRAARLAGGTSERERLLIRNAWAQAMDEPIQLVLAESLATRFPGEPEGHLFLGRARMWSGDFAGALPHLRRAVAMDSLRAREDAFRCLACDATADIVTAYTLADSLAAAGREAAAWTRVQPASARAWHALASTFEYRDRPAEAQDARTRAALLRSDNPRDPLYPVVLALRSGEFERADRMLDELRGGGSSLVQQNVLWYRVLSLRYQGRLRDALAAAIDYRRMVEGAATAGHPPVWSGVLEAQVRFEMGSHREAAARWAAMAASEYEPESPARSARHRAWTLTQEASARAAGGDTSRLSLLADSIESLGLRSAYGRDPRLHHFVRGLLHDARGDGASAAGAHRRAVFSSTSGYGRVNLELGRALLAIGRPREAAEVLQAGLRGPLDAANLYVSRTELHEMTARAWEASGRPDLARPHYRWVVAAWRDADPRLAERREHARRRLERLGG